MNNLKASLYKALQKVPESELTAEERETREKLAHLSGITILQLIYQQRAYEGDSKDYDFSATSMREHWMSGLEDTRRTLLRTRLARDAGRRHGHRRARRAPRAGLLASFSSPPREGGVKIAVIYFDEVPTPPVALF